MRQNTCFSHDWACSQSDIGAAAWRTLYAFHCCWMLPSCASVDPIQMPLLRPAVHLSHLMRDYKHHRPAVSLLCTPIVLLLIMGVFCHCAWSSAVPSTGRCAYVKHGMGKGWQTSLEGLGCA